MNAFNTKVGVSFLEIPTLFFLNVLAKIYSSPFFFTNSDIMIVTTGLR